MANIIKVLDKISNSPYRLEALYVNPLLLDSLFGDIFGGTTRILQSIEKSSDKELQVGGSAGISNSIINLFLDIKASITAQGRIGEHEKSLIEKGLTINKKIELCEAALLEAEHILDSPSLQSLDNSKFINITNKFTLFTEPEELKAEEMFDEKASEAIVVKWKRDRSLTPGEEQVALATNSPFPMYGIILVQSGLDGSTYISAAPFPGANRSVVAQVGYEEDGIRLLKIFWVVDKTKSLGI